MSAESTHEQADAARQEDIRRDNLTYDIHLDDIKNVNDLDDNREEFEDYTWQQDNYREEFEDYTWQQDNS